MGAIASRLGGASHGSCFSPLPFNLFLIPPIRGPQQCPERANFFPSVSPSFVSLLICIFSLCLADLIGELGFVFLQILAGFKVKEERRIAAQCFDDAESNGLEILATSKQSIVISALNSFESENEINCNRVLIPRISESPFPFSLFKKNRGPKGIHN